MQVASGDLRFYSYRGTPLKPEEDRDPDERQALMAVAEMAPQGPLPALGSAFRARRSRGVGRTTFRSLFLASGRT